MIFPIGFLLNLNTLVKVVLVFMSENCYIIVIWSVFGIGSVFVEIFSQFLSSVADINITMYFTPCCVNIDTRLKTDQITMSLQPTYINTNTTLAKILAFRY